VSAPAAVNDASRLHAAVIEATTGDLAAAGYAVAHGVLDARLIAALRLEAEALAADPAALDAGVGRGVAHTTAHAVRQSRIKWLDGTTPDQRAFQSVAEQFRVAINQRLFLGLFEFEAQLALYEPGGFYARHVDSFAGARNRIVSMIVYLTPAWHAQDGGELVIWPDRDPASVPAAEVMPEAGTVVLMMSEEIPHEVRVARRRRASIAGWWRLRAP
jgi:SM-20-related protein